jgi:hypothetical protein
MVLVDDSEIQIDSEEGLECFKSSGCKSLKGDNELEFDDGLLVVSDADFSTSTKGSGTALTILSLTIVVSKSSYIFYGIQILLVKYMHNLPSCITNFLTPHHYRNVEVFSESVNKPNSALM